MRGCSRVGFAAVVLLLFVFDDDNRDAFAEGRVGNGGEDARIAVVECVASSNAATSPIFKPPVFPPLPLLFDPTPPPPLTPLLDPSI